MLAAVRPLVLFLLAVLGLGYPLLVYVGLEHFGPRPVGAALLGLSLVSAVLRCTAVAPERRIQAVWPAALAALLAAAVLAGGDERLFLWLPVAVSLALLWLFGRSLAPGRVPLIGVLARIHRRRRDLPPTAERYTRAVTWLWCGFFLANAAVAGLLAALGPRAWWAAYCGGIAYGLIAALFAAEWIYRRWRIEPQVQRELRELSPEPGHE
jgi:uncharacterized membrane protein